MGVGLRLKEILRDRGITIKELAERANVPANTLYSITRRDSERVDSVVLTRVANALNVDVCALALHPMESNPQHATSTTQECMLYFTQLNATGRRKALGYLRDLNDLPKYRA